MHISYVAYASVSKFVEIGGYGSGRFRLEFSSDQAHLTEKGPDVMEALDEDMSEDWGGHWEGSSADERVPGIGISDNDAGTTDDEHAHGKKERRMVRLGRHLKESGKSTPTDRSGSTPGSTPKALHRLSNEFTVDALNSDTRAHDTSPTQKSQIAFRAKSFADLMKETAPIDRFTLFPHALSASQLDEMAKNTGNNTDGRPPTKKHASSSAFSVTASEQGDVQKMKKKFEEMTIENKPVITKKSDTNLSPSQKNSPTKDEHRHTKRDDERKN